MPRKQLELTDEERDNVNEQLYKIAARRVKGEKNIGAIAKEYGYDVDIAQTIQGLFGFSALTWRRAFEWYAGEFASDDTLSNLSLLYCASLPKERARVLHDELMRDHLSPAQVRARRDELKPRREKRKPAPQPCATCESVEKIVDLVSDFDSTESALDAIRAIVKARAALDGAGEGGQSE